MQTTGGNRDPAGGTSNGLAEDPAQLPSSLIGSQRLASTANPFVCKRFAERLPEAPARPWRNHKTPANKRKPLVDRSGFEPLTSAVQRRWPLCQQVSVSATQSFLEREIPGPSAIERKQ